VALPESVACGVVEESPATEWLLSRFGKNSTAATIKPTTPTPIPM
jgi:hypothetical protein